jgi:hypothetical protein
MQLGHDLSSVLTQSASIRQVQIDLHQTQSTSFRKDCFMIVHKEISKLHCGKVLID